MRGIKFRAWDGKRMGIVLCIYTGFNGQTAQIFYKDEIVVRNNANEQEMILMQYTGLKDKNGREIYEGDLLLFRNHIWVVEWVNDLAKFEISIRINGELYDAYCMPSEEMEIAAEIKGNKFENPELLKGAE